MRRFDDHFQPFQVQEGLPAPDVNGSASEALDFEHVLLRGFRINVGLVPLWAAGIQTVSASGGAVIIGDQASGSQTVNPEFSVSLKHRGPPDADEALRPISSVGSLMGLS
jgi:hypothetical protein